MKSYQLLEEGKSETILFGTIPCGILSTHTLNLKGELRGQSYMSRERERAHQIDPFKIWIF